MPIPCNYGVNYNGDYVVLFTSKEGKTFMNYQRREIMLMAINKSVNVIFKIKNRK